MNLSKSVYAVIIIAVLIIAALGFAIFFVSRPDKPLFHISDVSFKLGEENRTVELYVQVERGSIELSQLVVNETVVRSWSEDNPVIEEGEEARYLVEYPWRMNENYTIEFVTVGGQPTQLIAESPEIAPNLSMNLKKVDVITSSEGTKVEASYEAEGTGVDMLHTSLFTYSSFEEEDRNWYIFYDPDFMAYESIRRADTLITFFDRFNLTIYKVDYTALELLSGSTPQIGLIVVNPLKDGGGRRIENALPAPLIDPNENGYIRDDSRYGKSFVYDWMKDEGLVLVTVGSLQPHKRILYSDGIYSFAQDAPHTMDTHQFLTDASGKEPIIKGGFTLGDYNPGRISGTLGLPYIDGSFGFDKNAMEQHGLQYYAYGDYQLSYEQDQLNLTLPVFIQVDQGGWLAMTNKGYWLTDEQVSRSLFLIYMQSVWNSEWIPYGWYWDSGGATYNCSGILEVNGTKETEVIPTDIIGDKIVVRMIGVARSTDLNMGTKVEQMVEYELE